MTDIKTETISLAEQIKNLKQVKPRNFTKEECENMRKHYDRCGHKKTTCKKFDVSISELNMVLSNV